SGGGKVGGNRDTKGEGGAVSDGGDTGRDAEGEGEEVGGGGGRGERLYGELQRAEKVVEAAGDGDSGSGGHVAGR
ncbi:hypothetical protein L7F22_037507, partial [Adiantum nelumboides]|nr:hypothetical protein [Adiantum nelumboides]